MLKIFRTGFRLATLFIPEKKLVDICVGVSTWAVGELVKSTKTTLDDEALLKFKEILSTDRRIRSKI
jgi:hypothetical protein